MNPHPFGAHPWWRALEDAVAQYGADRTAFIAAGSEWESTLTFGEWRRASHAAAASLAALGVIHGDRVALASPGSLVWPILQTACSQLGAVLVPLNIRYRSDELRHVLKTSEPRVIFSVRKVGDRPFGELVASSVSENDSTLVFFDACEVSAQEPDPVQQDSDCTAEPLDWSSFFAKGYLGERPRPAGRAHDPVLLQYTSGTTAFPKGALLSSAATLGVAYHLADRMGLDKDDILFGSQPFYHVGGSVGTTLIPLTTGTAVVVPQRYTPEEVFRLVPRHRCTARTGQGAMYAMELAHPEYSPEYFRTVTKGWAAGSPELIRRVATDMGVRHVIAIYGLTECSSTATAGQWSDDLEERATSCGRALPGLQVGVLPSGSRQITKEPGGAGEVCLRGWAVMLGYANAEDSPIDEEGWLHTGDLGYLDGDRALHFLDRAKDMIKPGGENVSPAEVERVIGSYPGVERVAVIGRPDERLGEVPVAFVQLSDHETDPDALIAYCADRMASFKVPREVIRLRSWPMTESGKVRKQDLRDHFFHTSSQGIVGSSG